MNVFSPTMDDRLHRARMIAGETHEGYDAHCQDDDADGPNRQSQNAQDYICRMRELTEVRHRSNGFDELKVDREGQLLSTDGHR